MVVRLRPTLPHRHQCSTIGAEGLSFRVRNGAGRFPFAMTAETLWRCIGCCFPTVSRELDSGREDFFFYTHPRGVGVCIKLSAY